MSTIDKIIAALNEKQIDQKQLAIHLHLPPGIVSDWKKGRSHSYRKYIPKISEFLQVPIEYLLNEDIDYYEDNNCIHTSIDLGATYSSCEDQTASELLKAYYSLSLKDKAKALTYVCQLNEASQREEMSADNDISSRIRANYT